jgi:RNA polymerase sigma-70 factor (ECF subfamily)
MKSNELENVYKQYYKDLYVYALSLSKNHHSAEQLVSDTFFKALLSINNQDYIKPWLFRVCKNQYIDSIRKNKKHMSVDDVDIGTADVLSTLLKNEKQKKLYESVLALELMHRESIILLQWLYLKRSSSSTKCYLWCC